VLSTKFILVGVTTIKTVFPLSSLHIYSFKSGRFFEIVDIILSASLNSTSSATPSN